MKENRMLKEPEHEPTDEQVAIVEFAKNSTQNLMIRALAGAAKTTTLKLIARALPEVRMLCLAFGVKIAKEMADRLPPNCQARTLNSLGHVTWSETIGKRLVVDTKKSFNLLASAIKELPKREQLDARDQFADTLRIITQGKRLGYIPTGRFPHAKRIYDDQRFFDSLDEAPTSLQERLVRDVTSRSIEYGQAGQIDYDDQILLPTVFPTMFDAFPHVLIDEAQDLSELNHATLRKLVGRRRLTAVGDDCQSIYGFRGAHHESMDRLSETFQMECLGLSISFRCPQAVVRAARWRAPHMRWRADAPEGSVRSLDQWSCEDIPDDACIICRNNAPLFALAMKFLRHGRYCTIAGNDIGKGMLRIMAKFGPELMPQDEVFDAINNWLSAKLSRSRDDVKVFDLAACMRVFASNGKDLRDACTYAEHIFKQRGPVILTTAHKAKGLEFDQVFILDKHLIRVRDTNPIARRQEENLFYVAQTRAKQSLTYISTEGFNNPESP
jgi:DNA helicase II / ATP-dependent DNA helicase PcrA